MCVYVFMCVRARLCFNVLITSRRYVIFTTTRFETSIDFTIISLYIKRYFIQSKSDNVIVLLLTLLLFWFFFVSSSFLFLEFIWTYVKILNNNRRTYRLIEQTIMQKRLGDCSDVIWLVITKCMYCVLRSTEHHANEYVYKFIGIQ